LHATTVYDFVRPHKLLITGANYYKGYFQDIDHIESLDIFCGSDKISTVIIKELILNSLERISNTEFLLTFKNMPYFINQNYCNEKIQYKLTTTDKSNKLSFSMINEYFICFGDEIRNKILSVPQLVPTGYKHNYDGVNTENIVFKISSDHPFENILKGIIVDANCFITDLVQVEFVISGMINLVFDKLLLKTICKKISDRSIYIPIGSVSSSFNNRLDLCRLDTYEIRCKFTKKQNKLNVYFDMFDVMVFEKLKSKKGNYGVFK
jgi:hypothetical protein